MKTNFKKFMAVLLAVLMVSSVFSTLATAVGTATSDVCPVSGGDHAWVQYGSDEEAIVPPTCEKDGYTWIICDHCKKVDIEDIKFATGHTESEWIVDVEASCEGGGRDGKQHTECEVCKITLKTEVIPGLTAHKYEWQTDNEEAKCGENHRVYHQCVNPGTNPEGICGYIREYKDEIKKHNYAAYAVVKEPTCFEYGIMRYTCTQTYVEDGETKTCDSYVDVKIEKLAHTLVDHEGQAATCTVDGWKAYQTCSVEGCDYTTYETIPATGHTLILVNGETVIAPTCTEDGYIKAPCQNCDYVLEQAGLPATGHDFGDWYETEAPECEGEGTKRRDCNNCEHFETDSIEATGHKYEAVVTAPTCEKVGYTTYTCSVCKDSYTANETAATGHNWDEEWVCISGGDCKTASIWATYCPNPNCDQKGVKTETREYGTHPEANKINVEHFAKNTEDDDINDPTNSTYVNNECWIRFDCDLCGATDVEEQVKHGEVKGVVEGIIVEAATCTTTGRYADHCLDCGNWTFYAMPVEDHEQIAVTVPAVAPTCTETGLTEGSYCQNCGLTIVEQEEVPATGHGSFSMPWSEGEHRTNPTCDKGGYIELCCEACGEWIDSSDTVLLNGRPFSEALGHEAGAEADCENDQTCVRCDYVYVEAYGHTSGGEATCTEDEVCTACGALLTEKLGHEAGAEADCVNAQTCIRCDYVYVEALGHKPGEVANCKEDQVCTVCGAVLAEAGPDKHPEDPEISGIAITRFPTCTVGAAGTLFCHLCATKDEPIDWETLTEEERAGLSDWIVELLQPNGHSLVQVEAKVPTCNAVGWDAYEYCTVCDYTTYNEIPADAENHSALGYNTNAIPQGTDENGNTMYWARTSSCWADGLLWYYCDDCAAADTTGTYNGFTKTVVGSKMTVCHDYAKNGTDGWEYVETIDSTCIANGVDVYKCLHTYQTCDSTKNADGTFTYRKHTYTCGQLIEVELSLADHRWSNLVVTSATCTENGYITITCGECGKVAVSGVDAEADQYLIDYPFFKLDALGHDYSGAAATCTTDKVCARGCGEVLEVAFGHTPGAEATCTTNQICTVCLTELTAVLGHKYESVVIDPTCTEGGRTEYTCSVCDDFYYDTEVAALGHDYDVDGYWLYGNGPTCTTGDFLMKDCQNGCGFTYVEVNHALGHKYDAVVTAPTCTEGGYTTYTCSVCGDSYVADETEATGHSYEVTESEASTCIKEGYEVYTCTECDDTYTQTLAKTEHNPYWPNEYYQCLEHMTSPTCDKPGIGWGSYCQNFYGTKDQHCADNHKEIEPYGHSYEAVDPVVDSLDDPIAGCNNFGFTYTICRYCGEGHGLATEEYPDGKIWDEDGKPGIITDYVPALGHDWSENLVKDPSCTENGYYYKDCDRCDAIDEGESIPATGHKAPNHYLVDEEGNPVLDEDGKIQYCPSEYACENGCGTILSGHRDENGKDQFEYREEVICEQVEVNGKIICEKTHYEIAYCNECGYKEVLSIWISKDTEHNMVPDEEFNEANAATEIKDGKYKEVCANGCGYETTVDIEAGLKDQIVFDSEIYGSDENGNVRGSGKIVNGGYMAVKINLSGCDVNIWGISFDLAYDNTKLVFEHDLTVAANEGNKFVNDFNAPATDADMATLRVMSTYEEGDGLQNWNFTDTDYGYVTLIFAVKSDAYADDAVSINGEDFSFIKTEVIDNVKNDAAETVTFNEIGDVVIWKAANLDDTADLGLGDANDLMTIAANRGYDERADINWDGVINGADFRAMKKILMNDGLVDGYYEAILDGEIVA